jgi:PAS domain S-box-containing protein
MVRSRVAAAPSRASTSVVTETVEADAIFRAVFEHAAIGIALVDVEGHPIEANPALERLLGYTAAELREMVFTEFTHPDDVALDWQLFGELLDGRRRSYQMEKRYLRKDGELIWGHLTVSAILDEHGAPTRIIGMLKDITESKRADAELRESLERVRRIEEQRRVLVAQIVRAQEDERRLAAEDIHDGPVQKVTALAIHLAVIRTECPDPDTRRRLEQVEEGLAETIAEMRRLMYELRPLSLDGPGGLPEALREILRQLADDAEVRVSFEDRLVTEPSPECRVICFRIAREAAVNIRKHARATHVRAVVASSDGGVLITIEDDGVGLEAIDVGEATGHLGLRTMRERAELTGGWLELTGRPSGGTTVRFWIPLAPAA